MDPRELWLIRLLRLSGTVLLLAFLAALMPASTMRAVHEQWLGLGTFPASPLVDYLTRSISLLYGFHGALVWLVSTDVRRLRPVVVYLGWMNVAFGAGMLAIDLAAGLPWWWTWAEGPPILAIGVVLLVLVRAVPRRAS